MRLTDTLSDHLELLTDPYDRRSGHVRYDLERSPARID